MATVYDNVICPCCVKKVLRSERGIQCEKDCDRWFHSVCINMPDSEYQKYSQDSKKRWQCNRADCLPKDKDSLSTLSTQMANLLKIAGKLAMKEEVSAVNIGIEGLRNYLKDINKKLN